MNTKVKIAQRISGSDLSNYDELLEVIHNDLYRMIYKCEAQTFLVGNVTRFKIRDIDHANHILSMVKDVVLDAIQFNGIEVNFSNDDWENLAIIPQRHTWAKNNPYELNLDKLVYMSSFFEI